MEGLSKTPDDVKQFMEKVRGAILIPAGLEARQCHGRNCTEYIYDVPNEKKPGSTRPVFAGAYVGKSGTVRGIHPTRLFDGCGIDHHANCPDARSFNYSRKR